MWKIYDSFLGPVKVSPQVALALPGGKLTGNTVYLLGNNNKLHTDFIKGYMRAIWGLVGACQYYQDSRQTLISKPAAAGIKRNQVVSCDLIMWKSPESFEIECSDPLKVWQKCYELQLEKSVKQKLCVSLFAEDRNTQQEEWEKKDKGLYQRK